MVTSRDKKSVFHVQITHVTILPSLVVISWIRLPMRWEVFNCPIHCCIYFHSQSCSTLAINQKKNKFPPGLEPGTFRVLGERDNHYTTETVAMSTGLRGYKLAHCSVGPYSCGCVRGRTTDQTSIYWLPG